MKILHSLRIITLVGIVNSYQFHAMQTDFNPTAEQIINLVNKGDLCELFNIEKNPSAESIFKKRLDLQDRSYSISQTLQEYEHYNQDSAKGAKAMDARIKARTFYGTLINKMEGGYPTAEQIIDRINKGEFYELFGIEKNPSDESIFNKRMDLRDRWKMTSDILQNYVYSNQSWTKRDEAKDARIKAHIFYCKMFVDKMKKAYSTQLEAMFELESCPNLRGYNVDSILKNINLQ